MEGERGAGGTPWVLNDARESRAASASCALLLRNEVAAADAEVCCAIMAALD